MIRVSSTYHHPVQALIEEIETAIAVVAHGLNDLVLDPKVGEEEMRAMTRSNVSCYNNSPLPWRGGARMRLVSFCLD